MSPISLVDRVREQIDQGELVRAERFIRRAAANGSAESHGSELVEGIGLLVAAYQQASQFEAAATLLEWAIASGIAAGLSERGALLRALGNVDIDLGRLDAATKALASALKIHQSVLGEDHEETVRDLLSQADLERASGRTERANSLYQNIVERIERRGGVESPGLIEPLQAWVDLLLDSDLPHEQACVPAERYLRRLLELQEHGRSSTAEIGWTRLDLADLLHDHERCDEALEVARPSWDLGRSIVTEDPELFDRATQWLAGWYQSHDQPERSIELLKQSLEIWQRIVGPHTPKTAQSMGALAQAYLHAERLEEADALCERGLEILTAHYGEMPRPSDYLQFSPDDIASARLTIASLLWTRGAIALRKGNAGAVGLFGRRALLMLDINEAEVGEQLRPLLVSAKAEVLRLLGHAAANEKEGEALFQRAISVARASEGDVFPNTLEDYADWLQEHGRLAEADETRKQVDAWWESHD